MDTADMKDKLQKVIDLVTLLESITETELPDQFLMARAGMREVLEVIDTEIVEVLEALNDKDTKTA